MALGANPRKRSDRSKESQSRKFALDAKNARDGPSNALDTDRKYPPALCQLFGDMTGTKILDLHAGRQFFAVGRLGYVPCASASEFFGGLAYQKDSRKQTYRSEES